MNLIEALQVFDITTISGETTVSLKRRYRRLAKLRHPDSTGGGSEEFIKLQEAYVILKREVKDTGEVEPVSSSQDPDSQSTATNPQRNKHGYVVVDEEDMKEPQKKVETSISNTNELKALSKDELLEKYYNDTKDLNEKIGGLVSNYELHRNVLEVVESQVSQLSSDYRQEMNRLQTKYQKQIEKLEKNAVYRMWIRYFVSPVTGKDIWTRYKENVGVYEKERKKVRTEFNEKLLDIYGESLNEMSKYLTSSQDQ